MVSHARNISLEPHPVRRFKGVLLSYFFKVGRALIVTFFDRGEAAWPSKMFRPLATPSVIPSFY